MMEAIKHVPEIVFNWVVRSFIAVIAFIMGWSIRKQLQINAIDKQLAINFEADKQRDDSIQRIESNIRLIRDDIRTMKNVIGDQKEIWNATENERRKLATIMTEQSKIIKELL